MSDSNASREATSSTEPGASMSATPALTLDEGHCSKQIMINVKQLREQYCDVLLQVDGISFQAHKIILAALSPFFKARFGEDVGKETLELESMKPETFQMILDFAYSCSIMITDDNVEAMLRASTRLEATPLIEVCVEYLGKKTNAENFIAMKDLAAELSCASLAVHAKNFANKNFVDLCQKEIFLNLKPEQLIDIIMDDGLEIDSEEVVFDAVIRWIKHKEERLSLLPKVLIYVRLASSEFLKKCEKEEITRTSPICEGWINKALMHKVLEGYREPVKELTKLQRSTSLLEGILVCDVSMYRDGERLLHYYIDVDETCTDSRMQLLPSDPRSKLKTYYTRYVFCAVFGTSIYLLRNGNSCNVLEKYDFSSHRWETLNGGSNGKLKDLVQLKGCLYTTRFRDQESGQRYDTTGMNKYDLELMKSLNVGKMPQPVCESNLLVVDNFVYAIGGWIRLVQDKKTIFSPSKSVQRYNPLTNSWTVLAELPYPLFESAYRLCCAFKGNIYVIDDSKNIESGKMTTPYVYNIATNKWKVGVSLNRVYSSPAALMVLNGKLTLIDKTRSPYLEIERFSPATNSWEIQEDVKLTDIGSSSQIYIAPQAVQRPCAPKAK